MTDTAEGRALSKIRGREYEGWKLIGDKVTGWRFVKAPPRPRPFFGVRHLDALIEAGLVEEHATGCYRTTEKARRLLDD